jgi:hypothetical protein
MTRVGDMRNSNRIDSKQGGNDEAGRHAVSALS